jgi:hypothetical protein
VRVTSYQVTRDGAVVGTVNVPLFNASGLVCGTAYTFEVRSRDATGGLSDPTTVSPTTSACAAAASVFVSPAGDDANPCTAAQPCRTLDAAYWEADPGQVVEVAAGTYPAQTITVDPSKTSADDVVFRPAAGADPEFGDLVIRARHLEVRDLKVGWLDTVPSTDDVTLRNVEMTGFTILSSQNLSIVGGSVGPGVNFHPQIMAEWENTTPPRNILVDGVYFHDWTRDAPGVHTECLQIGGGDGITVRNSRFHNCHVMNMHVTYFEGPTPATSSPMTRNVTIENNVFEESTDMGGGSGANAVQANAYENLLIRNNSFAQEFHIFTGGGQQGPNVNVRVFGNVGPRASFECEPGVIFRYNVWTSGACHATDFVAASGFVNAAAGDLRLLPGAAAINRGHPTDFPATDITGAARPLGGAPDAGAYEAG